MIRLTSSNARSRKKTIWNAEPTCKFSLCTEKKKSLVKLLMISVDDFNEYCMLNKTFLADFTIPVVCVVFTVAALKIPMVEMLYILI